MKKLVMLLSGVMMGSSIFAAPVLNPADPALNTNGLFYCCADSCWSLRAGFRGDYVFNRGLENPAQPIDRYSLYSNAGVLTLNLWERIDIYGLVGSCSQNFQSKFAITPPVAAAVSVDYETRTIWGAGIKLILWEWDWTCHCGRSFLTAGFDYESVSSANANTFVGNGVLLNTVAIPANNYRESQVTLAFGHRIKKLIPYIAGKWSNARANVNTSTVGVGGGSTLTMQTMSSEQHFGYAIGASLVDVGRMTVTAEARFVDEKAMTITGAFRF